MNWINAFLAICLRHQYDPSQPADGAKRGRMPVRKQLLVIASAGLGVAGLIFILISMFGKAESNWPLAAGFFCVVLFFLFSIKRMVLNKKNSDYK